MSSQKHAAQNSHCCKSASLPHPKARDHREEVGGAPDGKLGFRAGYAKCLKCSNLDPVSGLLHVHERPGEKSPCGTYSCQKHERKGPKELNPRGQGQRNPTGRHQPKPSCSAARRNQACEIPGRRSGYTTAQPQRARRQGLRDLNQKAGEGTKPTSRWHGA